MHERDVALLWGSFYGVITVFVFQKLPYEDCCESRYHRLSGSFGLIKGTKILHIHIYCSRKVEIHTREIVQQFLVQGAKTKLSST